MLAVLTVVRNEATRWLPSVLAAWADFADTIIALDDGSTDATPQVLQACSKVVYHRRAADEPMWGSEAPVRQYLWQLGVASGYPWLMVLDADMVPARDPRPLLAPQADAVSFKLYDLWQLDPIKYRHDGFWQAHNTHRLWAFRNPGLDFEDRWPERGIHCGHFPSNLAPKRVVYAPTEYSLLHYAYSDPASRTEKLFQYRSKAAQLGKFEQMHAASIADATPSLSSLPFTPQYAVHKV